MNKKSISLMIIFTIIFTLLQGCAGKTANPVSVYRAYDKDLSCSSIMYSMHEIDENVKKLLPKANKKGKNIALGVTGALVFWPALLFMDFSDAEKVEIKAYKKRYQRLTKLYNAKQCAQKRKSH